MQVFVQVLGCRLSKPTVLTVAVDELLAKLFKPSVEESNCFVEVARATAFAKASLSLDLLVDMPDLATLGETGRSSLSHGLLLSAAGRPLRDLYSSAHFY